METETTARPTLEEAIGQRLTEAAPDPTVTTTPPVPDISAEQAQQLYESRANGAWKEQAAALISESEHASATWASDVEAERTRVREQEEAEREQRELADERQRTYDAERKAEAMRIDLLRMRAVNEHGLTPQQAELVTGTTSEQIALQVEALLSISKPVTASAATAGITGRGSASFPRTPNTLTQAVSNHYAG